MKGVPVSVPVPVPAPRYFTKCRVPGIYPDICPILRVFTLQKSRVRVVGMLGPYPEYCSTGVENVQALFLGLIPG